MVITSDFYGPHVVNELIRGALAPFPDDLVLVTMVGAVRGTDASGTSRRPRMTCVAPVEDNLRNVGLDALEVVNFRAMPGGGNQGPAEGSIWLRRRSTCPRTRWRTWTG